MSKNSVYHHLTLFFKAIFMNVRRVWYGTATCLLLPVIYLYKSVLKHRIYDLINEDLKQWCLWKDLSVSLFSFGMLFIEHKEFRSVVYYRIGWRKIFVYWLFKPQNNLTIACQTIDGGITVQHGYSTVICAQSIGKNFSVNQCVNIVWNDDMTPIIGDNVKVCAGAIIIGGVTIGNNVTIGGGCVVVKDIPSNSVVVGNPMRIIPKQRPKNGNIG
ncbi:LbetaH domain-containing protein [Alistipes provencensis]|uniref:serine acetyltransferase n=1 Tax=Alistipes provencensis TaxID=1816676 RepID=UPI0011C9FDDB|nr:serine acetyltransferase [Alistipes provencensis]